LLDDQTGGGGGTVVQPTRLKRIGKIQERSLGVGQKQLATSQFRQSRPGSLPAANPLLKFLKVAAPHIIHYTTPPARTKRDPCGIIAAGT
jgi:hypothetical protein